MQSAHRVCCSAVLSHSAFPIHTPIQTMSSASSVPAPADAATASAVSAMSTMQLLQHFLALQSTRSTVYSRFKGAFKTFLTEREEFEQQQAAEAEKRAGRSTVMEKAESKHADGESASSSVTTLADLTDANATSRAPLQNPEKQFQLVCVEVMKEFQRVSMEVRVVIATLQAQPTSTVTAAVAVAAVVAPSTHFATLLQTLQQLEKGKLELTIHQQMLHNQRYVLAHPQQHGQLHEHKHHVHSVTDATGRVREHPGHKHAKGTGGLGAVSEDGSECCEDQELADNAQPFTRHLSALLSDTAFATQSPFLFPPSGAAPPLASDAAASSSPSADASTLHAHSEHEDTFDRDMEELRVAENETIERINDIIEELRQFVMDEGDNDDEERSEQ